MHAEHNSSGSFEDQQRGSSQPNIHFKRKFYMKGKNSWYKIYIWTFFFGIRDTILAKTISFVHFWLGLRSTSLTLHCRRIRSWILRSCWGTNFTKHLPYSGRWLLGMIWSNSSMYLFPSSTLTICSWTSFVPFYCPFFPLYILLPFFPSAN